MVHSVEGHTVPNLPEYLVFFNYDKKRGKWMPVPVLLVGAAIAGVAGISAWLDGRGRKKTAKNIYTRHHKRYESDVQCYNKRIKIANRDLQNLVQRGMESQATLKQAVEFLKKARLRDRDLEQEFKITLEILEKWEGPAVEVTEVLSDVTKSVTTGASTALGVYGAVGTFGSASTGTAISTLSGAAAKNATLAWLGGGSLAASGGGMAVGVLTLGGLVIGPAALVSGLIEMSNATKIETEVEMKKAEIKVARVQIKQQIEIVEIVRHRIGELRDSIDVTEKSLQKLVYGGNPAVDVDAYKVAVTAKTLGELLDTPIIDERWKPTDKVSKL